MWLWDFNKSFDAYYLKRIMEVFGKLKNVKHMYITNNNAKKSAVPLLQINLNIEYYPEVYKLHSCLFLIIWENFTSYITQFILKINSCHCFERCSDDYTIKIINKTYYIMDRGSKPEL